MELFTGRVCLRVVKSTGSISRSLTRLQAPFSGCERRLCRTEGPKHGVTLFETQSRLSLGSYIYKVERSNRHNLRPQCRRYSEQPRKAESPDPVKKPNIFQKMKQMTKDYWHVLIPVHVVTSLGWVAILYTAAKNSVDVIWILEKLHVSERYIEALRGSSAGLWAVTYALYKICTPARYMVTVGGTTLSIKYLSRLGYLRAKPKTNSLQKSNQTGAQREGVGKSGSKNGQNQVEPPKT